MIRIIELATGTKHVIDPPGLVYRMSPGSLPSRSNPGTRLATPINNPITVIAMPIITTHRATDPNSNISLPLNLSVV
jgi:hypothetical protein